MVEMKINFVLVEFIFVNGGNFVCYFLKNGEFFLGIGRRISINKLNWFIIDYLFKLKLYEGKLCIIK